MSHRYPTGFFDNCPVIFLSFFLSGILLPGYAQQVDNQYLTHSQVGYSWLMTVSWLLTALATGVLMVWFFTLFFTKNHKKKYDFVNRREALCLFIASTLTLLALTAWSFTWEATERKTPGVFDGLVGAVVIGLGYLVYRYFRFYYPSVIADRLHRLRYSPRLSKAGNAMLLLNEDEEDVYLDEGMQQEEKVFSVNYDVWIDKKTQEIRIEEYQSANEVSNCPNCEYRTYQVIREKVLVPVTENISGELLQQMHCGYCGHKGEEVIKVARKKAMLETGNSPGTSLDGIAL